MVEGEGTLVKKILYLLTMGSENRDVTFNCCNSR